MAVGKLVQFIDLHLQKDAGVSNIQGLLLDGQNLGDLITVLNVDTTHIFIKILLKQFQSCATYLNLGQATLKKSTNKPCQNDTYFFKNYVNCQCKATFPNMNRYGWKWMQPGILNLFSHQLQL